MNAKNNDARSRLEQQEAQMLCALLRGTPSPTNLDPMKAEIARDSLMNKRLRAIIRHDPSLQTLTDLYPIFKIYCSEHPGAHDGGCRSDTKQFQHWLNKRSKLCR